MENKILKFLRHLSLKSNVLIFVFFFLCNLFFRGEFYFFDYDSVKNYTVIQEFQQGNFQNLFYHASPLVYTIFWLGNYIFPLQILQIIIHSLAMTVWVIFFKNILLEKQQHERQELTQKYKAKILLKEYSITHTISSFFAYSFLVFFVLMLLSSHFLWGMGDYLAMEGLSVLWSGLMFEAYFKSFGEDKNKNFQELKKAVFLFGVLYVTNYKAVMLLPVFAVVEVWHYIYEKRFSFSQFVFLGSFAVLPLVFFMVIGAILGVHLLKYPKIIAYTFVMSSGENVGFGKQILDFSFFYAGWLVLNENWAFGWIFCLWGCIIISPLVVCLFILGVIIVFVASVFRALSNFFLKNPWSLNFKDILEDIRKDPNQKKLSIEEQEEVKKQQNKEKQDFKNFISIKKSTSLKITFCFIFLYPFIMSFLPPAPRGLAFVYPFFSLFLLLCCFYMLLWYAKNQNYERLLYEKTLFAVIIWLFPSILLLIFNLVNFPVITNYNSKKNQGKNQDYAQIALYLHQKNIKEIATTQSIQLLPHAQKYNIKLYPLNHENEWKKLQSERQKANILPLEYVLLDDYCKILNTETNFDTWFQMPSSQIIQKWSLTSLENDLVFFEHAEFTKLNYQGTKGNLQKYRGLLEARLIRLGNPQLKKTLK